MTARWADRQHHTETIIQAALAAADPYTCVLAHLHAQPIVGPVGVLALGKAAGEMARAAEDVLGAQVVTGLVITKPGHPTARRLPTVYGGHPVPDAGSIAAADALLTFAPRPLPPDLTWLVLLSGGGSALLTRPTAPLTLADLQATTRALLACGAEIGEINTLRKHLDTVKGGQLIDVLGDRPVRLCVLSDVIGNALADIASGPLTPDPTTFADCAAILDRYALWAAVPESVVAVIRAGLAGQRPDTPKPADPRFEHVTAHILADVNMAVQGAAQAAAALGFAVQIAPHPLTGDVAAAAAQVVAALCSPGCYLWGGETTVTLPLHPGHGGRNQQLALAAAHLLAGRPQTRLFALATDGGDGPTDAAGAIVAGDTWQRAAARGLDPHRALTHCDAYPLFAALGDLLITGPTGTNVNDLTCALVYD